MRCAVCRDAYGLYVSHHNRKGMHIEQHRWVPREVLAQIAAADKALQDQKDQLDSCLQGTYSSKWIASFEGKTKKAVWRELVADGRDYPSLATFYTHVRQDGLSKTLLRYVRHGEVATLQRILGVADEQLSLASTRLSQAESQAQEAHATARTKADA